MSVLEVPSNPKDSVAGIVAELWVSLNNQREAWLSRVTQTRAYVTSPTTAFTEVGTTLPWKNKTVIPVLTQIADNLQSQYMAALMPSDDWFRFEGRDAESHEKANLIEEYLGTKLRLGGFRNELEKLIRDWILYGNCFGSVRYVTEKVQSANGQEIVGFRGPKLCRISPLDCVIDPSAPTFEQSPLIIRKLVPLVDILTHNESVAGVPYREEGLARVRELRGKSETDFVKQYKDEGLRIDGFADFDTYLKSQYVELLEYWGDIYDTSTGQVLKNKVITVVDRGTILRMGDNPAWNGKKPFFHVGWRILPDNLYGQGPLDHLVGMQYRIDHLENLKADAYDQVIHPMIKVSGDSVEDFEFGPGQRIYTGTDGDVEFLRPDMSVLTADSQIEYYRQFMEFAAGSPRESAGFRTPGEKTAFEMNVLQQGTDKMFIDKISHFEEFGIKIALSLMFELLIRNFDHSDLARTFNGDERALTLTTLTKENVAADGVFHALGAKYFATRNKRLQELQTVLMVTQHPTIAPHFSGLNAGLMLEEELGWEQFNIIEENIGIREQLTSQMFAQQMRQATGMPSPEEQEAAQGA